MGKLLKRTPLARKTPLARGDTALRRTPLAPGKPKRRAKMPAAIAKEVHKRSGGRCIVCGRKPKRPTRHHFLPVRSWPELELVADNMAILCWEPCHQNHEAAHRRIRWDELPECAIRLAHMTSGAAVMFLERHHPR